MRMAIAGSAISVRRSGDERLSFAFSQRVRGAEQVLPRDDVAGGKTELMRQIHRVGGDVVQPRDEAQRIQREAG